MLNNQHLRYVVQPIHFLDNPSLIEWVRFMLNAKVVHYLTAAFCTLTIAFIVGKLAPESLLNLRTIRNVPMDYSGLKPSAD